MLTRYGVPALFAHAPRTGGSSVRAALGLDPRLPQHLTARTLLDRHDGHAALFSVVRDPWERVASLYTFWYSDEGDVWPSDFRDWIRRGMPHPSREEPILYVGTPLAVDVRAQQIEWAVPATFLCRFETLADDFASLCDWLAIERRPLPHVNRSGRLRPPLGVLFDPESVAVVAQRYAEDIRCLGYKPPELVG